MLLDKIIPANQKTLTKPVLFCGAFKVPKNGTKGGVLYACQTLLSSQAAKAESWILIDSAQPLPPPPLIMRVANAITRFIKALWNLVLGRAGSTLVFSPFLTMSLMEKMSICFVSGLLGKPTVITFRSEIKAQGLGYRFIRPLIAVGLRFSTAVVCQSHEARDALSALFPKCQSKIHVIPNWIRLDDSELLAPRNDQQNNPLRITFIGWLEPIKDVGTILRALAILHQTSPNWQLSICGLGSEKESLEQLTRDLKIESQVEFLGWIDDDQKASILKRTDVFVMASLSEGMPNSIIEAMRFGIPVVATNVGGIPTLITPGVNGYLFDPRNESKLAEHLRTLLADPELQSTIGKANFAKIQSEHNVEAAAAKIISLLRSRE